jgi:hypothetical protein
MAVWFFQQHHLQQVSLPERFKNALTEKNEAEFA